MMAGQQDPSSDPEREPHLTSGARKLLDAYLTQVEQQLRATDSYDAETLDDLLSHIHMEMAREGQGDEATVRAVLERLGEPSQVAAVDEHARAPKRRTALWISLGLLAAGPVYLMLFVIISFSDLFFMLVRLGHGESSEPPKGLQEPRVIESDIQLSQSVFYEGDRFMRVSDLAFGNLDGAPGSEVGIAGSSAALLVNQAGKVESRVFFDKYHHNVHFIEVDGDGKTEFIDRAGHDPGALLDSAGHVEWSRGYVRDGKRFSALHMAAGDVDDNGKLEFAIATHTGVELVDTSGEAIWRQADSNVWHLEIVDTDGNGTPEIVHTNAHGRLIVRDSRGREVSRSEVNYLTHFAAGPWPTATGQPRVFVARNDHIEILDFDGKTVAELSVPELADAEYFELHVTHADLDPKRGSVLVVLASHQLGDRSLLLAFQEEKRVYAEVLDEECKALLALPIRNSSTERLLVGCESKVLEYRRRG